MKKFRLDISESMKEFGLNYHIDAEIEGKEVKITFWGSDGYLRLAARVTEEWVCVEAESDHVNLRDLIEIKDWAVEQYKTPGA